MSKSLLKSVIPHLQLINPSGLSQITMIKSITASSIINAINTIRLEKYSPLSEKDTSPFIKIISFIMKKKMIQISKAIVASKISILDSIP